VPQRDELKSLTAGEKKCAQKEKGTRPHFGTRQNRWEEWEEGSQKKGRAACSHKVEGEEEESSTSA